MSKQRLPGHPLDPKSGCFRVMCTRIAMAGSAKEMQKLRHEWRAKTDKYHPDDVKVIAAFSTAMEQMWVTREVAHDS